MTHSHLLPIRFEQERKDQFLEFMIIHFVKKVRIWGSSGPYFPALWENGDQKNSEYGHFSRTVSETHLVVHARYQI